MLWNRLNALTCLAEPCSAPADVYVGLTSVKELDLFVVTTVSYLGECIDMEGVATAEKMECPGGKVGARQACSKI